MLTKEQSMTQVKVQVGSQVMNLQESRIEDRIQSIVISKSWDAARSQLDYPIKVKVGSTRSNIESQVWAKIGSMVLESVSEEFE